MHGEYAPAVCSLLAPEPQPEPVSCLKSVAR